MIPFRREVAKNKSLNCFRYMKPNDIPTFGGFFRQNAGFKQGGKRTLYRFGEFRTGNGGFFLKLP